jgi:hypothetical protein
MGTVPMWGGSVDAHNTARVRLVIEGDNQLRSEGCGQHVIQYEADDAVIRRQIDAEVEVEARRILGEPPPETP